MKTCKITALLFSAFALATPAAYGDSFGGKHVLLISIDGMHALDFENCVTNNTCPNLASLGKNGVTYPRTSTPSPPIPSPG